MLSLIRFWDKFRRKNQIAEILRDPSMREMLLGVDRKIPRTDEKTKSDAAKLVNYARTEDYAMYAQELWITAIEYINTICNPDLKTEDVHFYRGCLSATMDDLRISHEAFRFLESMKDKPNFNPTKLNGYRGDSAPSGRN